MNRFLSIASVFTLLAPLTFAACAAPTSDGESTSTSAEAALTETHLEKSQVQVFGAKNTQHDNVGQCVIDATKFRVTYDNATLPAGTKLTLHIGESGYDQYFIGDGFGWASGQKVWWQNARDVAMSAAGSTWTAEIDVNGYGRSYNTPDNDFAREAFAPEIQFVFRLELPDGRVQWDNRLNRNYGATAFCSGPGGASVPLASWGPF
jgi:hypothetical protein